MSKRKKLAPNKNSKLEPDVPAGERMRPGPRLWLLRALCVVPLKRTARHVQNITLTWFSAAPTCSTLRVKYKSFYKEFFNYIFIDKNHQLIKMKAKLDKKKAASSSSSSESSSDEEIHVTPKVPVAKGPVKKVPQSPSKATPAAIPAKVPANKFPKKAKSSSSSSSSSSDSDDEPPKKKIASTPANKVTTPANNNVNNNTNNAKANKSAPVIAKSAPAQPSPRHVPASPKPAAPKTIPQVESPKKPTNVPVAAPITSSGDESYSRVEPKKSVTNVFGSNCPHCGKDIEVKVKFT